MSSDTSHPEKDADQSTEAAEFAVAATSETSWMITNPAGNAILGHVTQHDDVFTAYDAQELRIGDHPTQDDAIHAITTGTP